MIGPLPASINIVINFFAGEKMQKRKIGFTLLELIAVIVIIGVLATIAIPNYSIIRERSSCQEAVANLKLIAAAERIWRMENSDDVYRACECQCGGTAVNCCNNNPNGCNYQLRLSLNTRNWIYYVRNVAAPGNPPTFTATAERVGTGGFLDCAYVLTHNDPDGEPNSNGRCPAP